MKAWHWSKEDRRLGYGDGRLIEPGVTHTVEGTPNTCNFGLHGSKRILDALQYAPGPVIWRVELSGQMDHDDDKTAATERTYLWGYDATDVLRDFARRCALDVIHLWDAPEVVVRYLKTGDESIRAAARDAARAAAWDAAWAAVRAAARDAVRAAARDAAWAAARAAAWAAAWDAARDAAWDAAWDAARDAAWDAARDAAWDKQNRRLTSMVVAKRTR